MASRRVFLPLAEARLPQSLLVCFCTKASVSCPPRAQEGGPDNKRAQLLAEEVNRLFSLSTQQLLQLKISWVLLACAPQLFKSIKGDGFQDSCFWETKGKKESIWGNVAESKAL